MHEIFGPEANMGDGKIWDISYSDRDGAQVYGADKEVIEHLMINHFGGDRFMDGFWRLADRTSSIIYWPGPRLVGAVTRAETLDHLPSDMREAFAEIGIVRNAEELLDFMRKN
jgi:hypothetical protein